LDGEWLVADGVVSEGVVGGGRGVEERWLRCSIGRASPHRVLDGQHDDELCAGEATARSAAVVARDESDAAECRDRVRRRVAADAEEASKVTRAN
jgi:hypothetical protein